MATRAEALPQQVARHFAAHVRGESAVRGLWLGARQDGIDLWLVTSDTESTVEDRLYEAGYALEEAFPEATIHLHLLSPRLCVDGDPDAALPPGLTEVPLRAE